MTTTTAQQIALDNALVAPEKQVKIGKCNMRIDPEKTQKDLTYQVVLDALALTTCYPSFLIIASIPVIYMQQFWATINKHDSSYRFKIDKGSLSTWKYSERFSKSVLDFEIRNLMNLLLKKKFSPSSRNLATLKILRISLPWLLIICINQEELFLQSSTSI
ncbi:hypothetical protein Tco_1322149 [Tanacetum coccineum]